MTEIIKPTSPIIKMPTAETFAIVLNSIMLGFLNKSHTLMHLSKNDFNFSFIKIKRKKSF